MTEPIPMLVLAYAHGDVRAETRQQVTREILSDPRAVADLAGKLSVALKVFADLEYERVAQ